MMSLQELLSFQSYTTTTTQFSIKTSFALRPYLFIQPPLPSPPSVSSSTAPIFYPIISPSHVFTKPSLYFLLTIPFSIPEPFFASMTTPHTTFSYSYPYSSHQIFFSRPQLFNQFKLCQAPNVERRFVRAGTVVISPCLPKA